MVVTKKHGLIPSVSTAGDPRPLSLRKFTHGYSEGVSAGKWLENAAQWRCATYG